GTQALGLALRGHRVRGTDASEGALARAEREAKRLGAEVSFAAADFRALDGVAGDFDAVICCDNALAHMLDAAELRGAVMSMASKLRPGGLLVASIRDYDRAL